MIAISNPKIQSFLPEWNSFRGFSLLFDNPGELPFQGQLLQRTKGNSKLTLMYGLRDALDKIGLSSMIQTYGFCPLPFYSYHITCWDGINQGNIDRIEKREASTYFEKYLATLPDKTSKDDPYILAILDSPLIQIKNWGITFELDELHIFVESMALVAKLKTKGKESQRKLEQMKHERTHLYKKFEDILEFPMGSPFVPHITLGYFANQAYANQAQAELHTWKEVAAHLCKGQKIETNSISLYNFEDMSSFHPVNSHTQPVGTSPQLQNPNSFFPHSFNLQYFLSPLIKQVPRSTIKAREFFISWRGVPTLAYEGLPQGLIALKQGIEALNTEHQLGLQPENPGAKWPKTTLGCLKEEVHLVKEDLWKLREICDKANQKIREEDVFLIDRLALVLFQCRSLEKTDEIHTYQLNPDHIDSGDPPSSHVQQDVLPTLADFRADNLENYWEPVCKYGNRETHYRGIHHEATLVYPLPPEHPPCIKYFQSLMDEAFPGKYVWFEPESRHITVRGLG